jgi:hypothetical protein
MKKFALAALCLGLYPLARGQDPTQGGISTISYTVASLNQLHPASSIQPYLNIGVLYVVTDYSSSCNPGGGGGTGKAWCRSNGTSYDLVGSASGGGGVESEVVNVAPAATMAFVASANKAVSEFVASASGTAPSPLAANVTSLSISGLTAGQKFSFAFQQASSGTGPFFITWPTALSQACQISDYPTAITYIGFTWNGVSGDLDFCRPDRGPSVQPGVADPSGHPALGGTFWSWSSLTDGTPLKAVDSNGVYYRLPSFGSLTTHGVLVGTGPLGFQTTAAPAVGTVFNGQGTSFDPLFTATPQLGNPNSVAGAVALAHNASSFLGTLVPQAFSAARTYTLPDSTGTFVITATTPLSINAVTGAITLGAVPLSGLATQANDTVVMNATGSSAAPTAMAMPSTGTNGCAGASNALTYNTTTHALGCNSISGSGSAGTNISISGSTISFNPLDTSAIKFTDTAFCQGGTAAGGANTNQGDGWQFGLTNAGTQIQPANSSNTDKNHPCGVKLLAPASVSNGEWMTLIQNGQASMPNIFASSTFVAAEFQGQVKLSSTTDIRFSMGFTGSNAMPTNSGSAGCGIRYDTTFSDSGWTAWCGNGSATATAAITGTLDTNIHRLRVWQTAQGTVNFSVDGGATASITTDIPSAASTNYRPAFFISNDGTSTTSQLDVFRAVGWFTGLSVN